MPATMADQSYIGDLGNGLICRWSTPADEAAIARCLTSVFRNGPDAPIYPNIADEVRIMMSPGYPFMGPGDFAIVEDTSLPDRPIVACTCLWSHQWSYSGIRFGVGQPELVATLAAYRNRGLIRSLFAMVHARSAARGDLVQAITGIPYFYRQFGYEYVLDLGGQRFVDVAAIPPAPGEEAEPYRLRLATVDDAPDLQALYEQDRSKSLVWHESEEEYWRTVIDYWNDPLVRDKPVAEVGLIGRIYMIVDADGAVCGMVWPASKRFGGPLYIFALRLFRHVSWQAVMPWLLRALRPFGENAPALSPDAKPFRELSLRLGRDHPAYTVLGDTLAPRREAPYAWYLRVSDIHGFLRHIAPVLEQRLADSVLPGHSGELIVDFYGDGLKMRFERGKLAEVAPWRAPAYGDEAPAGCPRLIFLQLLFGYHSLAELRATFPDVYAEQEAALLLDILFPKSPSTVYSMSFT